MKKTIRDHKLLKGAKHIGVAVSGGKDSLTLLSLLYKVAKPMRTKLTAILIDEGIHGYRNKTIEDAEKLCAELGVELKIFSYKKEIGTSMDEVMVILTRKKFLVLTVEFSEDGR